MAKSLSELAEVIRSKNAGPYQLTFDIIFKNAEAYQQAVDKGIINKEMISSLYHIDKEDVISIINYKPAYAVKITIVRPISAGAPGERDVYGAQQHGPLLTIEI
ncbi:MAG: DUF4387 domain-containing protein [Halothermotrichaceae bacterium]